MCGAHGSAGSASRAGLASPAAAQGPGGTVGKEGGTERPGGGLALTLQSLLRHGCQVGRASAVCLPHGAPGRRLHQRGPGRTPEVLDGERRHPDSRGGGTPQGSSVQAQGPHKDPRARPLRSSPGPSELVWNPGSSQSTASSSQLLGGSAAGCRHGQPSDPR